MLCENGFTAFYPTQEEIALLPEGWFNKHDVAAYRYLVWLTSQLMGGKIDLLEIGSYKGRSLCSLASLSSLINSITIIETFEGTESSGLRISDQDAIKIELQENLKLFRLEGIATIHVADSLSFGIDPKRTYDLIFLDSDHTSEHVEAEIRKYESVTSVLAGHDYSPQCPSPFIGVATAISRRYGDILPICTVAGSSVWYVHARGRKA